MSTELRGKDLIKLGFKEGPAISLSLGILQKMRISNEEKLEMAEDILVNPEKWRLDPTWKIVVEKLYPEKKVTDMRVSPVETTMFGLPIIEEGALHQIYQAAKLPVSHRAALMPDAHQGYGLPIGGVLACENAIIPYGVGVDIGCRMALTLYDMPKEPIAGNTFLAKAIERCTEFGAGAVRKRSDNLNKYIDTSIIDRDIFDSTALLRGLKEKAANQLGTSGSGNHFVEFGKVILTDDTILPKGEYMGLLTHSGSRGLGAKIAQHYTALAKRLRKLDPSVANLAWFHMDEAEGEEYWQAMNLAGDYAKACHDAIHTLIARVINDKPLVKVENHHNFAWKEIHDDKEVIVHRKGATPAGKDVLGIIPGSMSTPGYIVSGKGDPLSLSSASHGAGRMMSRSKAKQSFTASAMHKHLKAENITLMGGGVDECTEAYKDIDKVMSYQTGLVDVLGSFLPFIVRMAGSDEEPED